jgi:hypothetical protein
VKKTLEVDAPVMKPESEWADPEVPEATGEYEPATIDVYFKRISSADQLAFARAKQEDHSHLIIYTVVVHPDGQQMFESLEQVKTLASWIMFPLIMAVEEFSPKK